MQKRLDIRLDDLHEEMVAEQGVWIKALGGREIVGPITADENQMYSNLADDTEPYEAQVAEFVLEVSGYHRELEVTIMGFDREGKVIFSEDIFEGVDVEENKRASTVDWKKILSPDSFFLFKNVVERDVENPLPSDLVDKLRQPQENHFSGFIKTDQCWYESAGKNVVANLETDENPFHYAGRFSDASVQRDTKVDAENGWLMVRPRNPLAARRYGLDSGILDKVLRYSAPYDEFTLDQKANVLAMLSPHLDVRFNYLSYLLLTQSPRARKFDDRAFIFDSEAMRFWSFLPESVRRGLVEKKPAFRNYPELPMARRWRSDIILSQLPPNTQREFTRTTLFSLSFQMKINFFQNTSEDADTHYVKERFSRDIATVITHTFGQGIPGSLPLKISIEKLECVMALNPKEHWAYTYCNSAYSLGLYCYQIDTGKETGPRSRLDRSQIRLAERTKVSIKFPVGSKHHRDWSFHDDSVISTKLYTPDTLPEPYRSQFRAGYAAARSGK
jgi:hypothetical protein